MAHTHESARHARFPLATFYCHSACSYWHLCLISTSSSPLLSSFSPDILSAPGDHCETAHSRSHKHFCIVFVISNLFLFLQIYSCCGCTLTQCTVHHCSKGKLNMNETSNFLFAKLMDWLTDCLCLSLSRYQPSRWLATFWLSYCLYSFMAIRFIYQSVCAYLNLWLNELMIPSFGLIYFCLCLCIFFLSVILCLSIHPTHPLVISIFFCLPVCPSWQGTVFAVLSCHISSPV